MIGPKVSLVRKFTYNTANFFYLLLHVYTGNFMKLCVLLQVNTKYFTPRVGLLRMRVNLSAQFQTWLKSAIHIMHGLGLKFGESALASRIILSTSSIISCETTYTLILEFNQRTPMLSSIVCRLWEGCVLRFFSFTALLPLLNLSYRVGESERKWWHKCMCQGRTLIHSIRIV